MVLGHVVDAAGMEGPVIAKNVDKAREDVRTLQTGLVDAGLEVEVRVATGDDRHAALDRRESHVDLIVAGRTARAFSPSSSRARSPRTSSRVRRCPR